MFKSFLEVLSQELGLVLCSFFAKSLRTNGSYVLSFPFDMQIMIIEYSVFLLQRLFYTARKTIFPFSKCSEKMVFPKKNALECDLSCIIRKNDTPFSRKFDHIL